MKCSIYFLWCYSLTPAFLLNIWPYGNIHMRMASLLRTDYFLTQVLFHHLVIWLLNIN